MSSLQNILWLTKGGTLYKLNFFLAKTDPETYSIDQFAKDGITVWDGVTNAQALQAIRKMKKGDRVFIYHSMGTAAVVGVADVARSARPGLVDPKLAVADFQFRCLVDPPVTLKEIKDSHLFDDWSLVRQSRLSTMEAPMKFVQWMRDIRRGRRF